MMLQKDSKISWLDLFFDLSLTAYVSRLSENLFFLESHYAPQLKNLFCIGLFVPFWWLWVICTLYHNRFEAGSAQKRVGAIFVRLIVIIFTLLLCSSIDKKVDFGHFIFYYCLCCLCNLLLYLEAYFSKKDAVLARQMIISRVCGLLISAYAFLLEDELKVCVFFFGIMTDCVMQTYLRRHYALSPAQKQHLLERFRLLYLIILGELLNNILNGVSRVEWTIYEYLFFIIAISIVFTAAWGYIYQTPLLQELNILKFKGIFIWAHLFVCLGLISISTLIRSSVAKGLYTFSFSNKISYGVPALVGVIFFFIGKLLPYYYHFTHIRKELIYNCVIALFIFLLGFTVSKSGYLLFFVLASLLTHHLLSVRAYEKVHQLQKN